MPAPAFDPTHFGLPTFEQLQEYEIWDSYFLPADTGPDNKRALRAIDHTRPTIEKGALQRLCVFLHVGLGTADPVTEARLRNNPDDVLVPLKYWPERILGMLRLNANDVDGSLAALDRWMRDGPMVGVYFQSGARGALACSHKNLDPLVKRIAELGGVIMQHTWFKTGGKDTPGESTPAELAELAARHRDIQFVCAHAGGEWERGIRAVRASPNILVETSGFDSTAGFIDMAVRELGAERIVFGSHLPSRSLGTELSKILGAQISEEARRQILGANLRKLLGPILKRTTAGNAAKGK